MKINFLIVSVLFFFVHLSSSCGQISNPDTTSQAQALVNEAGALLMAKAAQGQQSLSLNKAVKLLKKSLELDNTLEIASQTLISCYINLGQKIEAIGVCDQWLSKFPKDDNTRLQRGMLNYNLKKFDRAQADFDSVGQSIAKQDNVIDIKLNDNDLDRLINLSYINCVIGNQQKADEILERLRKTFPESKDVERVYKKMKVMTREDIIMKFTGS